MALDLVKGSDVIELYESNKDTGRLIVPYTTRTGLRIGIAWTPKPCPVKASCGEHHIKRWGVFRWLKWSVLAVLAVLVIAGVHA